FLTPAMVLAGLVAVGLVVVVRRSVTRRGARTGAPGPGAPTPDGGRAPLTPAPAGAAPFDAMAGGFPVPPLPHQQPAPGSGHADAATSPAVPGHPDAGHAATPPTEEARHA